MKEYRDDFDWYGGRRLATSAGFFLPYVKPGITLLDCGCGPGSITVDFAEALAPGRVTAIDIDPYSIDHARAEAAGRDITNISFQVGDLNALPFPDNSFDAVWVASVMQYMREPLIAAREMFRVLKPGGVLGERDRCFEGDIIGNANPRVRRLFGLYYRWSPHLNYGARSRSALIDAGFANVISSASYETQTPQWTYQRYSQLPYGIEEMGWTERRVKALLSAFAKWAQDPKSYFCMARGEERRLEAEGG